MQLRSGNRVLFARAKGFPLGAIRADSRYCIINGTPCLNWRDYVPSDDDRIEFPPQAGAEAIVGAILSAIVSFALQALVAALSPKPKQPNQPKNEAQRYGIAGLDNTIEEGTPVPVVYGERRVFPHVIGSRTDVSDDGRHMTFSVLGLVGDTGGDGYQDCTAVEINEIKLENYAGASFEFRLGTDTQTIVPGFENVEQTFADGRSIPHQAEIQSLEISGNPTGGDYDITVPGFGTIVGFGYSSPATFIQSMLRTIGGLGAIEVAEQGIAPNRLFSITFNGVAGDVAQIQVADRLSPKKAKIVSGVIRKGSDGSGAPIVYTTRSPVNEVTIIFQVPGMFTIENGKAFVQIQVEKKRASEGAGAWTLVDVVEWKDKSTTQLFKPLRIALDATAVIWDFRFSLVKSTSKGGSPTVFNVQETQYTNRTYPGSALLCIRGIGSHEIQSLSAMRWSALWKGKKVKVWNGSTYTTQWTQKRMWILRDMMTHPKVGLGTKIPESMFDDNAALTVQNYLDETVNGEVRDLCDALVSEQRPGWNYITEDILGEAACSIIPSGRKMKVIVDKPRSANLLWVYPGNILDDEGGPVKTVLAYQGKSINTLRGTFPNAERSDKTRVIEVQMGGVPATDIKPDSYQYDTVRRATQVQRHLTYLLKKSQIKTRRSFKVGNPGQVVEPGDLDYVSDDKVKNIRGWQGRCPGGSTTTRVVLSRIVELENGKIYEIIIRHAKDNVTEKRTIQTGPGKWGRIDIAGNAFTAAPKDGDWWAIGEQFVAVLPMVVDSIAMEDDGNFRLVTSLYDPALYDDIIPQAKPSPRFIGAVAGAPPIPLLAVNVDRQLVNNHDGTWSLNLAFDVTPGLHLTAGKARGGSATTIRLQADAPAVNDYFNTARVTIIAGQGGGQEAIILDYDAATQTATLDRTLSPVPNATSEYEIRFDQFGLYKGFKLEVARDANLDSFTLAGSTEGTHFEIANEPQGITEVFRFTPISMENVENHTGRWTKQIVTIGDTGAPAPPIFVGMASHLKQVRMEIRKSLPTEADFAGFDIEFYLNTIGGTLLRQTSVAVDRDDTKGGQLAYEHTESFEWINYGKVIIGRARAFDDSNNPSAWVNSSNAVALNEVQTVDVEQNAITNSQEMFNAGPISHAPGGVTGHTHLGNVTVTTGGGQVEVNGSCNTENEEAGSADFRLVILLGTSYGSDPLIGDSIITLNDLNHRGTNISLATLTPAPGTYTFSLWMESNQDATVHRARMSTFEVKR